MKNVRHKIGSPPLFHTAGAARFAFAAGHKLFFLILALWLPLTCPAADPYAEAVENHFATEGSNHAVLNDNAVRPEVAGLDKALIAETRKMAMGTEAAAPPVAKSHTGLVLTFVLLVGAGVAFLRFGGQLLERFNLASDFVASERSVENLRAEEKALSEFLLTFKSGPTPSSGDPAVDASSETDPGKLFYARAKETLLEASRLLQTINAEANETMQRNTLLDLHRKLSALKGLSGLPELLPIWQMAAAMEGLVKQLTDKISNATPSTLRTLAGGVEVLKILCVPGVRADILTNPPVRLLAVDDDPICRQAISHALKKALNRPDLAENGEAALALATQHVYDVIFLDVQMPGMDGFEICAKIHETVPNAGTPTVFVTVLNDFEARAQSILKGGSDLISKPFLTFEITVKALTFILMRRLQAPAPAIVSIPEPEAAEPAPEIASPAPQPLPEPIAASAETTLPKKPAADQRPKRPSVSVIESESKGLSPQEVTREFLTRASSQIDSLRELIQTALQTEDETARQEALGDFYLRFNSLMPQASSVEEHPALRLSVAVEGLLKKILSNSKHVTSSSLLTISTAVDLLRELCAGRVKPDLASNPPIRMLAVDDDPVSLRAITGTLQVVFEKPESADSGEAALALAANKSFDVIFMDVQMPGMDGFAACLKIHETAANRLTPVVFVTGQTDFKARSQADASGGSDFIAKPFLTAEVTVKALTYALSGRLQKSKAGQPK